MVVVAGNSKGRNKPIKPTPLEKDLRRKDGRAVLLGEYVAGYWHFFYAHHEKIPSLFSAL